MFNNWKLRYKQITIIWWYPANVKFVLSHKAKILFYKGWEINKEQKETILECQMCERNACQFRSCLDLLASPIFCKDISDRFQGETTSTAMSNHSTSDVMFALRSTTGNHDQHQLPTINDRLQKSGNCIPLWNSKNWFLDFLDIYFLFLFDKM